MVVTATTEDILMHILLKLVLFPALLASFSVNISAQEVLKKLAENVYSAHLFGYTSLVVIGNEGVLITDTANTFRAKKLKAEIGKLTDKPVTRVVLTHEHFDHTGGTDVFKEARVIAQSNARSFINLDPLDKFPDQLDLTYDENLTIQLGTTNLELKHFGAADGVAMSVVYLPAEKIALSADLYSDKTLTAGLFLTDTNQLGVRRILNEMVSWDLKHAVNVHSDSTQLTPLIEAATFYNDLYNQIFPLMGDILKTSPSHRMSKVLAVSEDIKMPVYKGWKNYDSLNVHAQKMIFAMMHGG